MGESVLTVVLGSSDVAAQRGHLARGALFVPQPEPPPEPFAEITLRVLRAGGASSAVELRARVLQILSGRVAIAFDDLAAAKQRLAPILDAPTSADDGPTRTFWGRADARGGADVAGATEPTQPTEPTEQDEPPLGEEDEASRLREQIAAMSGAQKMQLAMKGDRVARLLLLKEPNKNVQTFILQNPRITLDEVRYIAGFRQASPDVLVTIAANRDWVGHPAILSALVRNPKTPSATAVKLVDKLPMAEIRRLAKSNDVPRAVQTAARKRVAEAVG